ncbi:MAG TPA: hypothetical protein VHC95_02050 [Opitutales bacterium]|nr:hypothetical protein [Opitutales bacterium]
MKIALRNAGVLLGAVLAAIGSAGCPTVRDGSATSLAAAPAPAQQTVRVVNAVGAPVSGIAVTVYPLGGKPRNVGITNEKGELVVPVAPQNLYVFLLNRRTLLGQTAENLFSPSPAGTYLYQRDGNVVVVPVDLSPGTNSPLVSPVIDPLKAGK